MADVFRAKLRKVGGSFGIIIPKEQLECAGTPHVGQHIDLAIIPHRDPEDIDRWFGIAKGAPPFRRDKKTREF